MCCFGGLEFSYFRWFESRGWLLTHYAMIGSGGAICYPWSILWISATAQTWKSDPSWNQKPKKSSRGVVLRPPTQSTQTSRPRLSDQFWTTTPGISMMNEPYNHIESIRIWSHCASRKRPLIIEDISSNPLVTSYLIWKERKGLVSFSPQSLKWLGARYLGSLNENNGSHLSLYSVSTSMTHLDISRLHWHWKAPITGGCCMQTHCVYIYIYIYVCVNLYIR